MAQMEVPQEVLVQFLVLSEAMAIPKAIACHSSEALTHLMTLKPKDPPPPLLGSRQEGGLWESRQARTKWREAVLSNRGQSHRTEPPPGC